MELMTPQGYIEFQGLIKHVQKVISDSGGLQKEAYLAGKPCVTLRTETEWVVTVKAGWNILLDADDANIAGKIMNFIPEKERPDLYGKNVAKRMVKEMERFLVRVNRCVGLTLLRYTSDKPQWSQCTPQSCIKIFLKKL